MSHEIISTLAREIDQRLHQLGLPNYPANLYDPINYILKLGGKRLRPILCLLSYRLFDTDLDKVYPQALSLEVFHNFTLMHDDIMDEAPLRRGEKTVHEKWDSNVGILSGDAMLVKAYQLLSQTDARLLPAVLDRFNTCALDVCEGQQLDMDFESIDHIDISQYLGMIEKKTAALIGFSFELGGLVAQANPSDCQRLLQLGTHLGIAFQLQDDLLDVYGGQEVGKQPGGDIINGKKTYLMVTAMKRANENQHHILQGIKTSNKSKEKIVSTVKEIYGNLEVYDATQDELDKHMSLVKECLAEIDTPSLEPLKNYLASLAKRSF